MIVLQTRSSWATSNAAIVDVTDPKSQKPLVLSNDIDMSHVTNVKDVLAASFIFPRQCSPKNVKVLLPLRNNNRPKTRLHCTVKFVWPTLVWSKLKQYSEVPITVQMLEFRMWNHVWLGTSIGRRCFYKDRSLVSLSDTPCIALPPT